VDLNSFIFPSFYEGFGLPVLEAMACGTPIVCSNTTSIPEIGGNTVVYCNPYDVNDIKEKIETVLNNKSLQKDMIKKGLEKTKQFTWEESAQKHLEVFKEVLKI
jgi:glycosyltransferase involved in cell wall biosynthesis